jgi:signal peptidase II
MRPDVAAGGLTGLFVAASVLVIDQASKDVAVHGAPLVPRNPDYAFGLVGGSAATLTIAAIAVLGVFLVASYQLVAQLQISPILPALVLGGTLGNVIDRIRLGSVTDFVYTPWAIINVADVAVAIGVLGLTFMFTSRLPRRRRRYATVRSAASSALN